MVTATYQIIETKNGKTAGLVNLILDKDPVFYVPQRRDNAGEDWDNVERTENPAPAKKEETSAPAPAADDDSDKWA